MKKNILYFHHSGNLGGAPKSLRTLLKEVDKNVFNPFLIMIDDGPGESLFQDLGIPVIINKKIHRFMGSEMSGMTFKLFIKNLLGVLPTYFNSKKVVKQLKPSVIHLNTTCLFVTAMAAKKVNKKIKIVSHVREPLLKSFAGKILKYMNYKYVDYFIPISRHDESTIKHKGNSKVVYNSVDFDEYNCKKFKNFFRKEINAADDEILVTYLGRIVPQNGVDILIEAAKQLKNENKIKFVIAGFNNEKDSYADYIREISADLYNVRLINFRKDTPDVIASSDIIVFPSVVPHFARSVIEASAMGKPSIASNIGGVDELIINGKTGLLVPPGSSKVFANAIKYLAEDEFLRFAMGQKAYEMALENFDSKKNAEKVFQIYE